MKKRPLIMAVDDEHDILRLLSRTLEPEGYSVIATDNSISALVLLQQRKPDLVILDIMMPVLDGFQVLDFIRKCSNIPVIMLTGRGGTATLHDALVLGADDYVRKPFYPRELVARIRAKLRRAETGGTLLPSQLS